jgi:hypothetical protein
MDSIAPSFAPDQKPRLLIHARQSRLIGLWAAHKMGFLPHEAETYAKSIVRTDIRKQTPDGVLRKISSDLAEYGVLMTDEEIHQQMEQLFPAEHHD